MAETRQPGSTAGRRPPTPGRPPSRERPPSPEYTPTSERPPTPGRPPSPERTPRPERAAGPEASAVPDILAPQLSVVFCGINPGRRSAAAGAHFANPRNDFWRLLHAAGFTPRLLSPQEQHALPSFGIGITNAAGRRPAARPTSAAPTSPGARSVSHASPTSCARGRSASSARRRIAVRSASGRSTACRRGALGHAPLRASVHLAGERGRAVGRAAALVPRAARGSPLRDCQTAADACRCTPAGHQHRSPQADLDAHPARDRRVPRPRRRRDVPAERQRRLHAEGEGRPRRPPLGGDRRGDRTRRRRRCCVRAPSSRRWWRRTRTR